MSKTLRKNVSRKNKNTKKNSTKKNKINNMKGGVLPEYIRNNFQRLNANDPTLKEVLVMFKNIGDEEAIVIAEALKVNTKLTTLNISANNIGVAGAQALAEALKVNTTLTSLNMSMNNIGYAGAEALANALGKDGNRTLTTLNINYNNIGVEGAIAIAEALKENTTLTTLNIGGNYIGDVGIQFLAEALKVNTRLTTLDISGTRIGDGGMKDLADALKVNTTLRTLDISNSNIGAEGVIVLASALKDNKTLRTLDISYNNIGVAGAQALADMLKENKKLTKLDIIKTSIGVEGVKAITEALGKDGNNTLLELYISRNGIGDQGIAEFATMLTFNNKLLYIDMEKLFDTISNTNTTDSVKNLKSIRQKLEINKKKKHSNLVNNVTTLSALYSEGAIKKLFSNGVKLQNQYKSGLRHLTYNSQEGILTLTELTEDNKKTKTNNLQNAITFFEDSLLSIKSNNNSVKNNSLNNFFKKKTNKNTNTTRSDEAILNLLLYFPLIKSFVNNDQLIFNLRYGGSAEIMHYIKDFNTIVVENSKKKLPLEVWRLIFSFLNTDELKKFKKALTF